MEPFLGMIVQFGGNFAPRGWALCNGQLLSIMSNQALFSILGTTYGGDGVTSFGLPDLRGRAAIHAGHGPGLSAYRLGQKSGHENVTLNVNTMPAHDHQLLAVGDVAKTTNPSGAALATGNRPTVNFCNPGTPNDRMNAGAIQNTGNSQPFGVVQPYQCVNWIIALQGLFPSRN